MGYHMLMLWSVREYHGHLGFSPWPGGSPGLDTYDDFLEYLPSQWPLTPSPARFIGKLNAIFFRKSMNKFFD